MYKTRIARWGLDKKLKKSEVEFILRIQTQRSAIGKKSAFQLRGRPVDMDAVERYRKRSGITMRDILMPKTPTACPPATLRCTTPESREPFVHLHRENPPSSPRDKDPLIPNEILALTQHPRLQTFTPVEEILHAIRAYINGSFEAGAWVIDHQRSPMQSVRTVSKLRHQDSKTAAFDLYALVCHSWDLFRNKDFHNGGICLRKGFSRIPDIIREEDPFAAWELLNTVSYLQEEGWLDVLQSILRQLSEMAASFKSRSHPLCRIFTRCHRLSPSDLFQVIATMRQCAADEFEHYIGSLSVSTVQLRLGWLRAVSLISGREAVEQRLKALLGKYQSHFGPNQTQCLLILNRLAHSLYERGQYAETEAVSQELLMQAASTGFTGSASIFSGRGLNLLCRAQVALGKYLEAEANLQRLLDLNVACYGWSDPLTITSLKSLENCLAQSGRELDAANVRAQRLNHVSLMDTTI
jgi:hypothetical protein